MTDRKLPLVLALLCWVVATACSGSLTQDYIGRTLEPADAKTFETTTGEHEFTTQAFKTRYDYGLDADNGRLMMSGSIHTVLDPTRHQLGAILERMQFEEILVSVLLTDANGKVVDVQQFNLYPYGQIFHPVPFTLVLDYQPAYRGASLRITAYMLDGTLRLVSRQLNAFNTSENGGVETGGPPTERGKSGKTY